MNVKDRESILIGFGDVRCGFYHSHRIHQSLVFDSSHSIGKKTGVSISVGRVNRRRTHVGLAALSEIISVMNSFTVQCSFIELSLFNILTMLGLDNSTTAQSIYIDEGAQTPYFRIEAIFDYPLNNNKMAIIVPKAKIVSDGSLEFENQSPSSGSLQFDAVRNDVKWGARHRLARIFFFSD